jgi:hypothetical protein
VQIVSRVASALQTVLGVVAGQAAQDSGAVKRKRKFCGATLVQTFVLGFLHKPQARAEDLALTAGQLGVEVTPRAVQKRYTPALTACLRAVLDQTLQQVIAASPRAIPLLQKFTAVRISDSTTLGLPDEFAAQFPGCGGTSGAGRAAMKLQVSMDQLHGSLPKIQIQAGRDSDAQSELMSEPPPAGSLSLCDLGYFSLSRFGLIAAAAAGWISRLHTQTKVFDAAGQPLELLEILQAHRGAEPLESTVLLGQAERLPCRLIALRAPAEVVAERRRKAYRTAQKSGQTPSDRHLAWLAFTIFVTNCDAAMLTWKEVVVLYRTRWQIELLFKLWKSHNRLATHSDVLPEHQMIQLYARMIGVILQHWMLLTGVWTEARHSLWKAARILREHLVLLLTSLKDFHQLCETLERLARLMRSSATLTTRKKRPGTFQLLHNPELLQYVP